MKSLTPAKGFVPEGFMCDLAWLIECGLFPICLSIILVGWEALRDSQEETSSFFPSLIVM